MKPKAKKVSLSGKTRLSYREAVVLLSCAYEGFDDVDCRGDEGNESEKFKPCFFSAITKLKTALGKAGGYDADGNLYTPSDLGTD